MKTSFILTMAALAIAAVSSAADSGNLVGMKSPNARIFAAWLDLGFNQQKMDEAFDSYVSRDNYVNHSVYGASTNTKQSFEEEKAAEIKAMPHDARLEIKQIVAQGDLVIAHILAVSGAEDSNHRKFGDEIVVIVRIRNGKIVDHWDMHAALKEDSMVFVALDRK